MNNSLSISLHSDAPTIKIISEISDVRLNELNGSVSTLLGLQLVIGVRAFIFKTLQCTNTLGRSWDLPYLNWNIHCFINTGF
jgi:hypothetical protein